MPAQDPGEQNTERRVRAYFDDAAGEWRDVYAADTVDGYIYRERRGAVMRWVDGLRLPPGATALDVGCGAGLMAADLASRRFEVHALDASAAMVELARGHAARLGLSVQAQVGNVYALDFPAGAFDLVIAVGVLPWLGEPARALAEMARILRASGHLIVTSDNRARLKSFVEPRGSFVLTSLRRARLEARRRANGPSGTPYWHRWPSELNRLLAEAGLESLERRTLGFGPFSRLMGSRVGERNGLRIHRLLQRGADAGVPGLRATGWHDLALARKPGQAGAAGASP